MRFTYDAYFDFLRRRRTDGYALGSFDQKPPRRDDRVLLLRHDVDFDLDAAVELATAEQAHDVQATYFILLTSSFYNADAPERREQIQDIARLGHWIGLHYDAGDRRGVSAPQRAARLAKIADASVRTVSYHRPAPELIGSRRVWFPLRHTYQPEFVHEIEYCSDSTGEWRYGPPEERPAGAMQLLTHPEWWGVTEQDREARLNALADRRAATERSAFLEISLGASPGR